MHQAQWSPERPLPPPVSLASQRHHEKPPVRTLKTMSLSSRTRSAREAGLHLEFLQYSLGFSGTTTGSLETYFFKTSTFSEMHSE